MDALERAQSASWDIERYTESIAILRQVRLTALREAESGGVSRVEMSRSLGISLSRVNQLLGSQYARGSGVKGGKSAGEGPRPALEGGEPVFVEPEPMVEAPEPAPHRHRYASQAWNHARGGYLVRQRCECGDVRVVPAPSVPKDLLGTYPDASVLP